jgi:Short repeat of unknown function (DUF308)
MSLEACPKCGNMNESNTSICPECHTYLEKEQVPVSFPDQGKLIKDIILNVLGLVVGVILILLGIISPAFGSAILQIFLVFTENDVHTSRTISEAKPNASDGWIVIVVGVFFILAGIIGLYVSLKKRWDERVDRLDSIKRTSQQS